MHCCGGSGGRRKPPVAEEDEDDRNMRLAFFPLTDLGNAERFGSATRTARCNTALGWLAWDGKRWSSDGADDLVMIAEHDTVRAIQAKPTRSAKAAQGSRTRRPAHGTICSMPTATTLLYSDKLRS